MIEASERKSVEYSKQEDIRKKILEQFQKGAGKLNINAEKNQSIADTKSSNVNELSIESSKNEGNESNNEKMKKIKFC